MKVQLFVLNYNGFHYISDCIESLVIAIKNSKHECQLTVIDNESTDKSVEIIEQKFPSINLMKCKNRVLCSFNEAVKTSKASIVFLLNNDLKVDPFFIDPLISVFNEHENVFLAAPKSFLFDGSYEGGFSVPFMTLGTFQSTCHFQGSEKHLNELGLTFATGFGAFDRDKFVALGGYDDLYLPGRMEDADLSLRAWKMGWKSYYEPKSIVYHLGAKSFRDRFGVRGTMEIAHRNTFLFTWKNIHDFWFLLSHFIFLLPRTTWMLLKGRYEYLTAFIKALGRLPTALQKRRKEKSIDYKLSEKQIISIFKNAH